MPMSAENKDANTLNTLADGARVTLSLSVFSKAVMLSAVPSRPASMSKSMIPRGKLKMANANTAQSNAVIHASLASSDARYAKT